jgi:hypothetical protein
MIIQYDGVGENAQHHGDEGTADRLPDMIIDKCDTNELGEGKLL